ncbi:MULTISPECIES: arginine repressor [Enterococcaceae]|uniref:arginine repressor n=1 Tax=Enterococcaceae TaxID=81852 RepID=UPI000E54C607|nr:MULTISPECIES: ArgR family transcriptional regulator [Enterococcaceae]MCI0130474.1 ArgR family transcriptional regulator [Vagococcus sp. CY53-2]RGI32201.1 ArgR family transcriptional regulator [Melissococcus sp. OM08-11BH]UNM89909.1 ArgR family transcriptional regulator [Vagococcus sp. CY52-2]
MRKSERQKLIKKIIFEENVGKQEELVIMLKDRGIPVTQATVSRDIKELNLIKQVDENGVFKYFLPKNDTAEKRRLEKMMGTSFISIDTMDNLVNLQLEPGVGVIIGKLVEFVYEESLFTVVSNDDKLLIITRTHEQARMLEREILSMT